MSLRFLCFLLLLTFVPSFSLAQSTQSEEEINVLAMLEVGQAEVANSDALIVTTNCFEASRGYAAVDKARVGEELHKCFRASVNIADLDSRVYWQSRILTALHKWQPDSAVSLARRAEPQAASEIWNLELERLIAAKQWDKALEILALASNEPGFPFSAAVSLMQQLPPSMEQQKTLVFQYALKSYRLEPVRKDPKFEDMATLIIRFADEVPAAQVEEAINEVLSHARQDSATGQSPRITIGTATGQADFSSPFQYRLFQLLPTLRSVNPEKAAQILRDHPELAGVLKTYPDGLRSLEPTYRSTPLKQGEWPRFSITYTLPQTSASSGVSATVPAPSDRRYDRLIESILNDASRDPSAAISKAKQLPSGDKNSKESPRAECLGKIAGMMVGKDAAAAEEAVSAMLSGVRDLAPLQRAQYIIGAIGIYDRLGNTKVAIQLMEDEMDMAKAMYVLDTNRDHPNLAPKLDWPSAVVWRATAVLMARISPNAVSSFIEQIPDLEIRASSRIAAANEILRVEQTAFTMRTQTDAGPGSVQTFRIPLARKPKTLD